MKQMELTVNNVKVVICDDYVSRNPADVDAILKRVSHIVSESYHRRIRGK